MNAYKKLIVWQKADELAEKVYEVTRHFPHQEQFGLTSQLRRAAVSVPVNIVEGVGRQGRPELKRFTGIALGSFSEVEYLIHFCKRQRLISDQDYASLEVLVAEVGALLWRFYKSF